MKIIVAVLALARLCMPSQQVSAPTPSSVQTSQVRRVAVYDGMTLHPIVGAEVKDSVSGEVFITDSQGKVDLPITAQSGEGGVSAIITAKVPGYQGETRVVPLVDDEHKPAVFFFLYKVPKPLTSPPPQWRASFYPIFLIPTASVFDLTKKGVLWYDTSRRSHSGVTQANDGRNALFRRFQMKKMILALVAGALVATAAGAQQDSAKPKTQQSGGDVSLPQKRLALLGVYDAEGHPIAGAVVRDTLGNQAETSKDGVVALNYISPMITKMGWYYLIEVRKENFRPLYLQINIDSLRDRTEVLEPAPLGQAQMLPASVTTVKATRSEIESRAKPFTSKYILAGELGKPEYASKSIGDVLERKFGIILPHLSSSEKSGRFFGRKPSQDGCIPRLFLDGNQIAGSNVDLNDQAGAYDGAEFYPPHQAIPSEFGQQNGPCGTLALYTRGR